MSAGELKELQNKNKEYAVTHLVRDTCDSNERLDCLQQLHLVRKVRTNQNINSQLHLHSPVQFLLHVTNDFL